MFKRKNTKFLFISLGIFICLFTLNITITSGNNGVDIKEVSVAKCINIEADGCQPSNWVSCNKNDGIGQALITDCATCEIVQNAKAGSPNLCCYKDPSVN